MVLFYKKNQLLNSTNGLIEMGVGNVNCNYSPPSNGDQWERTSLPSGVRSINEWRPHIRKEFAGMLTDEGRIHVHV